MMVAMGNVDCGVMVWIVGWWPWECWPWGGGVENGMVAMGNIGHKGVVMASGMMVAMGNVGHGMVVWTIGWWPWGIWAISRW